MPSLISKEFADQVLAGTVLVPLNVRDRLVVLASINNKYDDGNVSSFIFSMNNETLGGDFWKSVAVNNFTRSEAANFSLNGFGYVCAGVGGGSVILDGVCRYNDTLNSWATKTAVSLKRAASCFSLNGFGYFAAGNVGIADSSDVFKYDDGLDVWVLKSVFGTSRSSATGFDLNGLGYIYAGWQSGATYLNEIDQYVDSLDIWLTKMSGGTARKGLTNFVDEKVFVCGGSTGTVTNEINEYNDSLNSWLTKVPYIGTGIISGFVAREQLLGLSLNGFGYLCNGFISADQNIVEQYIKEVNTFITKKTCNSSSSFLSGFVVNGFGYISNGYTSAAAINTSSQYRSVNMYEVTKIFKKSLLAPKKVLVGTNINKIAKNVPVWLQVNGADWKYMESNKDSLLKKGELIGTVLTPYAGSGIYEYKIKVGMPNLFYIGEGFWTRRSNCTTAKQLGAGFSLNGFGYFVNGIDVTTYVNENIQYNDELDVWTIKQVNTLARSELAGFALNGFGYVCDGNTGSVSNLVDQYNDILNVWVSKAVGGSARSGLTGFALNGFGYISNGWTTGYTVSLDQYNDKLDIWTAMTSNPTARDFLGSFSLNGFGYVCNGETAALTYSNIAEKFIDSTNSWLAVAAAGTARSGITGFSLGNFGYVSGGDLGSYSAETNQYNAQANIWTQKGDFYPARKNLSSFALNDFGYIFGGYSSIYLFDSSVNQYKECLKKAVICAAIFVDE